MTKQAKLREEIRSIKRYISASITAIENQYDKLAYNRHADVDMDELSQKEDSLRAIWREFDELDKELDNVNFIEKSIAINENHLDNLEVIVGMGMKVEKIKSDIVELESQRDEIFKKIEEKINSFNNKR